jgi:hypothetical protein
MGTAEADGFDPNGVGARRDFKRLIRRARSAQGDPLGEGTAERVWDLPAGSFIAGVLADRGSRDRGRKPGAAQRQWHVASGRARCHARATDAGGSSTAHRHPTSASQGGASGSRRSRATPDVESDLLQRARTTAGAAGGMDGAYAVSPYASCRFHHW